MKRFDYCFAENGLVAYKDGVQIGQQVGNTANGVLELK